MAKHIVILIHRLVTTLFYLLRTERRYEIPTGQQ